MYVREDSYGNETEQYYGAFKVSDVIDRISFDLNSNETYYGYMTRKIKNEIKDERLKSIPDMEKINGLEKSLEDVKEESRRAEETLKKVKAAMGEYSSFYETSELLRYFSQCVDKGLGKLSDEELKKSLISLFNKKCDDSYSETKWIIRENTDSRWNKSKKTYDRDLINSLEGLGKFSVMYRTIDPETSKPNNAFTSLNNRLLNGDLQTHDALLVSHSASENRRKEPVFSGFYTGYKSYESLAIELYDDIHSELYYDKNSDLNKSLDTALELFDISANENNHVDALTDVGWARSFANEIGASIDDYKLSKVEEVYKKVVDIEKVIQYLENVKRAFANTGKINNTRYFKVLDEVIQNLNGKVNEMVSSIDMDYVQTVVNDFNNYKQVLGTIKSFETENASTKDMWAKRELQARLEESKTQLVLLSNKYSLKKVAISKEDTPTVSKEENVDMKQDTSLQNNYAAERKNQKLLDDDYYANNILDTGNAYSFISSMRSGYIPYSLGNPNVTFGKYAYENHFDKLDFLLKSLYKEYLTKGVNVSFDKYLEENFGNVLELMPEYFYSEYLNEFKNADDRISFSQYVKNQYNIDNIKEPNMTVEGSHNKGK